ncbi:hypothetical protein [Parachitinimonas caeni]|uniref:HNH endonuclease n=1 Tax=Parachitinimonas caeni TaxID=3031301 RepID=A0ABT7E2N7_9NEIS|nr:hypothetical protein [Parachitinimonas caeni]MDK2126581.1 hypothetical protein [Parachitinimonas caeni]
MGASSNKRKKFLQNNPLCAFCGGKTPATTIEHCPPRGLFQDRQWPEGFEFPACANCNRNTSDDDLLVIILAKMAPKGNTEYATEELRGQLRRAEQQFPGILDQMMPSATTARKYNESLGLVPAIGRTHQKTGILQIPDEFHEAIYSFARKLAKGIYYNNSRSIFPSNGGLAVYWFSNVDILQRQSHPFEFLQHIPGTAPDIVRSGKYLHDQFEYKISTASDFSVFIIQALFGNSFGLIVLGNKSPGQLEAMLEKLSNQTNHAGAFKIIQSHID